VVGWVDIERVAWEGMRHVGRLGMGLLPEFRGRGLGRMLLQAALTAAAHAGLRRVELEVYASNGPAIALYRAMGFDDEGRKVGARELDGRPDDLLVMAMHLQPPGSPDATLSRHPKSFA
jgi:ribosomal protein S18 acetylase RimI-like enzyme